MIVDSPATCTLYTYTQYYYFVCTTFCCCPCVVVWSPVVATVVANSVRRDAMRLHRANGFGHYIGDNIMKTLYRFVCARVRE